MNILITGANGFIGSNLCRYLENEHRVFRLVKDIRDERIDTINIDLCDEKNTEIAAKRLKKMARVEVIIHLASILVTPGQTENWHTFDDNIAMTKNLIALVKALMPKKLINFSSIAVYPNKDGKFNEKSEIKTSPNAECLYGLSKFCSENLLDFFLKNISLTVSHLRVAQVYGPGMREDRIISIFLKQLKEKNTITVLGGGRRTSNFIHIDKLINIVRNFIERDLPGIFNVGDENLSYTELAQRLIAENGNRQSRIIIKKEGTDSKFFLDLSKIHSALRNKKK